jgi:hypothetical protein
VVAVEVVAAVVSWKTKHKSKACLHMRKKINLPRRTRRV